MAVRQTKNLYAIVALAAVLTGLAGCNTSGCENNRSALPMMGFYNIRSGEPVILDSIDFGGVGAPGDSLLVSSGESTQSFYFPLRFDYTSTAFYIHYDYKEQGLDDPALNDTLTFSYSTKPFFESEECGAYYVYHIDGLKYTKHLIDSVAIVDSLITSYDMERVKVFFRLAEPETPDDPNVDPDNPDNPDNQGKDPEAPAQLRREVRL